MKMRTAKKQVFLKTVSFILAAAITLNIISMSAFSAVRAESADMSYNEGDENPEIFSELPDSAELESMYIDRLFYGEGISLYKDYGRTALDGVKLEIYEALRTQIEKTAAGENTETVFTVDISEPYNDSDILEKDVSEIVKYLMADLPQDFYWYDKRKGYYIESLGYSDGKQNYFNKSILSFAVSEDYADKSAGMVNNLYLAVDPSKINSAKKAAENAQKIAEEYSGMSNYEKILGYKNRICNLTEYDHSAADNTNTPYGDPWQLVYVFDDDPDTNVVCEGYAKAFQYLCDLGGIECCTVTGELSAGTGAGGHMWNVVVLKGKSYLVDITNCDGDSIGSPDLLLLKGAAESNSDGCTFDLGKTITYTYDKYALALYTEDIRTVSAEDFDPDAHYDHTVCEGADNCPDDVHGEHEEIEWTAWKETTSLPDTAGNYYLTADVRLGANWEVPSGTISLCLNGHKITPDKIDENRYKALSAGIIYIDADYTFELCDCTGGGTISENTTISESFGGGISNYGTFNMYSGKISGNTAYCGGGVHNNRTFNMYGGEINGNISKYPVTDTAFGGGGLYNDAIFNMYGGKISENSSVYYGGGVHSNNGTFNMLGGEISENTITYTKGFGRGGGVYNKATFNMYSGKISGNIIICNYNTANTFGAGVSNENIFNMYGGKISGNNSHIGAGVSCRSDNGSNGVLFNMHGGEISGNTAIFGGGLSNGGEIFKMLGGKISENTATYEGGGVYMFPGGYEKQVILGKNVVVKDNTCNAKTNNLYFPGDFTVTLDPDNPLSENAYIGVTVNYTPVEYFPTTITGENDADYSRFFHSDDPTYEIINSENNEVQLSVHLPHAHKICAGADNCPDDIHGEHQTETWTAWEGTAALPSSKGYYYLTSDVTLTETWRPTGDVSLCLNGHTVSADNAALGIILIEKNTTFNLCDCKGGGKISGNTAANNQCGGGVTNSGTFNMYSGEISKNTVNNNAYGGSGGGVSNGSGAMFNMYDGEISENNAYNAGGGVDNRGGADSNVGEKRLSTFYMYGGKIINNSSDVGGGVSTACEPDRYTDIGIETFGMYGGEISNNSAAQYGGGVVYTASQYFGYCQVTLGGEAVIKNNTCNGNNSNLYIPGNKKIPEEYRTITLDEEKPLAGNAYIGVTTEIKPTEDSPTDITKANKGGTDYSGFFHSDDPAYEIINSENNAVQLVLTHVHSFVHIEAVAPTCTETGNEEYYVCDSCWKIFDKDKANVLDDIPELEAIGHKWGKWIITAEPTENSGGEAERICGNDETHIDTVELKELPDTTMWTKTEDISPGCVNEGRRVYTSEYGTVTVTLKKLSHDYEEDWKNDSAKHWQKCKNCGTVNPDSENPHIWDEGKITVEPTAEHEGEKIFTCKVCGYTRTEKIPKLESTETEPSSETSVTPPSETDPPVTPPGETKPPVTPPSETKPPVTPPSETEPPVTPPSETEPPVIPPSETEPPVTPPSETEPPVTPPGETEPPVTPPIETEPPVTPPSDTEPVAATSFSGHFVVPETSGTTVTEQIISDTETAAAPIPENTTTPPQTTEAPVQAVQGSISKRVESPDYIAEIPDSISELANNVLTRQEILLINSGSVIEILLTIDKISTVSNTDSAAIREALNGFKMWQYLDINLYRIIDGTRYKLSGTSAPVTIKINIPEALRESGREYAMVRVHDGAGEMINDLDSSADTITFTTDRFSVYVLVYKDKEINEEKPLNTGVDSYTSIFLATGIAALSASMTFTLMGTGIMGMSEETKNKVYDKLIRWGKGGGKTRKTIALALIFLLLSYYYTIGVRVQEECDANSF